MPLSRGASPSQERPKADNVSFTIWQLRTSYLSTIKDGIGDRLINVNNSVLNTPGFRAAGWSSASANPYAQTAAAHIKRAYSPPIPTTTAVSGDYYRFSTSKDFADGMGFGAAEDGEDEEGGMVTGKSNADVTGRRQQHVQHGKKPRRRERQQQDHHRQGVAEEDDSSDLSDESDDDGEAGQRSVFTIFRFHLRALSDLL